MRIGKLDFNAPVILSFTMISAIVLGISAYTGEGLSRFLGIYFSAWKDPYMYMRLFTHVIAHADFAHFTSNFMLILAVGPMVEEKYGSKSLLLMILATALITGMIHILMFKKVLLLGSSGIAFMLILLASYSNLRQGQIPLTVILVALIFIGNEIYTGFTAKDGISQISHIIGGVCGGVFGFLQRKKL